DYRLSAFSRDLVCRLLLEKKMPSKPVVVGASLGVLTSILLAGELHPGVLGGLILVDIVPDMEPGGADRIQAFMADKITEGFGSLDEVADAIAAYNPHRPRPSDLSGLRKNLRE